MARGGLLKKLGPELLAALGIGGAAALSSEEDDNMLGRGLAGAAVGGAGMGLAKRLLGRKGLLGRVKTTTPTQAERDATFIKTRRALGDPHPTRMPTNSAMQQLEELADLHARTKYANKLGDRKIMGALDDIGEVGSKVWDGVDAIAARAAPVDRLDDIYMSLAHRPHLGRVALGVGAAGGAAAGGVWGINELLSSGDKKTQAGVLQSLGFDPTPTGLKMFQADSGIPITGEWDDATIAAAASAIKGSEEP